jgi:hypothetical protein
MTLMALDDGTYDPSPAALKPLLDTFWGPEGWRRETATGAMVPERAVVSGVMFREPRALDHDGWVAAVRAAASTVSLDDVSLAFLASLTSRRLDLRSALGSFAVARQLPVHPYEAAADDVCRVCGLEAQPEPEDLNVLSFERFMWGGIRRDDLPYLALDLEMFARAPLSAPTEADLLLAGALIDALRTAPEKATVVTMTDALKVLKGNKAERRVLLEILGVCGILTDGIHHGYGRGFVDLANREQAPGHWMDTAYPACWWRGRHGLDDEMLQTFLPALSQATRQ